MGPYLPASPGLYYVCVFPEPFDIVGGALVFTFAFLGTSEGAPVCAPALGQLNYCFVMHCNSLICILVVVVVAVVVVVMVRFIFHLPVKNDTFSTPKTKGLILLVHPRPTD